MMNSDMDQIPAGRWSQNILRNVNAMLDREIAYKVSTLPTINTSVRGLWRLATSNEVLGLLSILCLLIFAIQVLASINCSSFASLGPVRIWKIETQNPVTAKHLLCCSGPACFRFDVEPISGSGAGITVCGAQRNNRNHYIFVLGYRLYFSG